MTSTKKKIAVFLDNAHIPGINFQSPELGNPGTGATECLHVAIPYFLKKYRSKDVEPVILAIHTDKLPEAVEAHKVKSVTDATLNKLKSGS